QAAEGAGIIIDVSGAVDVIFPKTDFVVVAFPVAIFRAIEYRGRRMRDEDVHERAANVQRDVPMILGGKAKRVALFHAIEGCEVVRRGSWIVVEEIAGHIFPKKILERAHALDGIPGKESHSVLAGVVAKAIGVVSVTGGSGCGHDT